MGRTEWEDNPKITTPKNAAVNDIVMIPFVAHESSMTRMEKIIKLLIGLIALMIIGVTIYLVVPNEIVEETTTSTQEVDDVSDSEIHQTIGE